MDAVDHVDAVQEHSRTLRGPQRGVQDGAVLGDVDPVAAEHRLDLLAEAGDGGELEERGQRGVVDLVLAVVDEEVDRVGVVARAPGRVLGEQRAKVGEAESPCVLLDG